MIMRARTFWIIWWALTESVWSVSAHAQTAQEIAKKAFASTVLLVIEDANGQPRSLGSGFFVRTGEIASNLHVVEGATRGYAKLIGEKAKYDIEGITAVDPEHDLVILKISAARSQALPLGNSDAVQVGEPVYAVGNPQGLEGTFSQGIVSSIREVGTDKLLQITAPISPGSSGGPVLSGKGEVIGVSVATFKGGQNLNFAIPSSYLKILIAKAGPVMPLAQATSIRNQKSILSDQGERSSDGVIGGQLKWTYPMMPEGGSAGTYTLSLRNRMRENVRNVHGLVIFYDSQGNPIDVDSVHYSGVILAGLAKRLKSKVDASVKELAKKIEFRILNFEIDNANSRQPAVTRRPEGVWVPTYEPMFPDEIPKTQKPDRSKP